jgi:hypothetical protein
MNRNPVRNPGKPMRTSDSKREPAGLLSRA